MQNHLQAMREKKEKSIAAHLETHLIWLVCLRIYNNLFLLFVKINVAFLSPGLLLCFCAALAPFSAVYVSG